MPREPGLDPHAYRNVVGGDRIARRMHDEGVVEFDREYFFAEHYVPVPPTRPLHVVAELTPRDSVELCVDEVVQTAMRVQVGEKREFVRRVRERYEVFEHRDLQCCPVYL